MTGRFGRPSRGFTIIEIIVVLALMGILAAITGPRIGSGIRGAQVKTSVRRFAAALRAARTFSVTHHSMIVVVAELGTDTCRFNVRKMQSGNREGFSGDVQSSGNGSGASPDIPEVFREPFVLEGDVRFRDIRFSGNTMEFTRGAVMFLPQGNSTGGVFILGPEEGPFYEVSIDPVTGRVHTNLLE
ncbi:MAG TPA: type II secretion system protein [bacterium]|nr:type II secretion system protein [bacterium]